MPPRTISFVGNTLETEGKKAGFKVSNSLGGLLGVGLGPGPVSQRPGTPFRQWGGGGKARGKRMGGLEIPRRGWNTAFARYEIPAPVFFRETNPERFFWMGTHVEPDPRWGF